MECTEYIEKHSIILKCTVQSSKKCYILHNGNFLDCFTIKGLKGSFFYLPGIMEILIDLIHHTRFLVIFFLIGMFISNKDKDYNKAYFIASCIMLILELAILGIITLFTYNVR